MEPDAVKVSPAIQAYPGPHRPCSSASTIRPMASACHTAATMIFTLVSASSCMAGACEVASPYSCDTLRSIVTPKVGAASLRSSAKAVAQASFAYSTPMVRQLKLGLGRLTPGDR